MRDKPIRQAETSCIVANIQRKFVPERVARRLPVSRRLRRGGGRGEETAICGPLTNATFPSRLTRGFLGIASLLCATMATAKARTIHARVRSARKKKKLGSASQPRTKLLTASYRTSCCVPSHGRRTTCRGRELVSVAETVPSFKAPASSTDRTVPPTFEPGFFSSFSFFFVRFVRLQRFAKKCGFLG